MKKIGSLVFRYWWYYLFLGVWFFLLGLAPPAPVYGFDYADASLSEIVVNWGTGEQSFTPGSQIMHCMVPNNAAQVTIKLVPVQEYIDCTVFRLESTAKDGNARIERPAIYDNHDLSSQTPPVSVDLSIGTTQYEIDTYATNALGSDSDEQEYALLITRTPQVNLERPALNGQPYIVFTGTFTGSFFGEQLGQYPVQRFDPQYYQHYFFGFLTLNDIVCTATEVSGLPSLENVPLENIHLTMSNRFLDYDNTYYYYNGDFSDWFWHEEWVGTQDPELTLKVNENVLLSSNHLVNVADSELNPTPGWIESWFITSYAEGDLEPNANPTFYDEFTGGVGGGFRMEYLPIDGYSNLEIVGEPAQDYMENNKYNFSFTVLLTANPPSPTIPGTLGVDPIQATAGQSDYDVSYTYTTGQALDNGSVEIHSELTTFNQFDELLINNHPPEASLNQEISGDGQTITIKGLTLNAGDTIAVIQPGRTLPSAGQYTVWAQSDADGEGQKWAASPGTGEEQKTVFLTDPIVTPTTPGTLAIYPDPPTAGQSDQDVVYTYTCGQNLSNGTFTITSEFTSFSVYNAVKLGESNWRDLTADEISDDGDRVTIKDIYLSAGEAIQIGQAAQTMPAAGNYSITVSVDADGDALAYLPSSESFSLQVMEGGSFINGKVNYIDEPVANIQVVVQDFETTDFVSQTFTDSDGEFRLEVSPGTYQVVVEPGTDFPYARSWYDGQGGTFVRQELIPVTLSEGQSVTLEPFFLEPGACISGLVTDAAGNGLAGIGVVGEWLQQNGGVGTGAETGPDGSYILTGLRYGQYKVWAPGRWMPNDNYWAQTFYDGKSSWDEADIITVNGASINGIDLVLSPAGVISGYVMTADGDNPIASLHVFAVDYETGYWIAGTDTDDNGLYRLILPVGKYRVRAQSSQNHQPFIDAWYNAAGGTTDYELAEPVTVNTGAGTENINFRLQGGFFISGQVTDQQGKGIENLHVYTENELTDQWTSGTETDDEGYYSLVVPAGEYRIHALPFAGQPYAAVWYNHAGGSIFDNAMEIVDVSANVSGIDFILPPGGWISGRVVDMNGNGLADISLDACLDEWCNGSRSELDGSYTISGLPYGYYLVMCPSGGRWSPADSFWLRSYYDGHSAREDADIIELGPAVYSYDNIDFTLQSGGGISGQVLLGDGETPMAGVHVYAQDYSTGIWGDGTETDENGFFSLIVPAGSYRVKAVPSANGWPYMDEWYNSAGGSGIPEQAQPVEVSLNTVTDDIDFTLEPMNTPVVKVSSANGAVGSIVEISIGSDYVAGAKGAQFKLHYNPAVVEIVQQTGATGSPLFDNEGNPLWEITSGGGQLNLETNVIRDVTQAQTGFAYIAIASQDQLSSTFCTIKFRLIGAYGDFSHIWITPTEDSNGIVLSDGSPEGIPCLTEEGVITIGVLHGDINNNGVVDVGDAILALRYDAGLIELAPSQELAANVNGDLTPEGEQIVNYQDAILILRKVVHLIDFFPITPLPGGGGGTPMIPEN